MAERSRSLPAVRGGDWNGDRPAWSRAPFQPGNQLAVTHGFYSKFGESDQAEVEEIGDSIRSALPLYSSSFEPLIAMVAAKVWRWRRAYAYLAEHGEDASRSLLQDLNVLERGLQRDLADLGCSPKAAARLGVDLVRLADATGGGEGGFDWNRLDPSERRLLSELLAKGEADA
jgi:hypothetical protein